MGEIFAPARVLGFQEVLISLLFTFVLTMAIATIYRWTYQGLSYSRSFVHTQILGGIVATVMIMAIGDSLARGLGILGTLAIIRFRTPIRDPRDIIFLFACFAVGIGSGAGVYPVVILGTVFFCVTALFLHISPFASRRQYEGILRFMLPVHNESEDEVKKVLRKFCTSTVLVAMREAVQGEVIEYSYQIRLKDPSFHSELLDQLHNVRNISDVNLIMQRATVEL